MNYVLSERLSFDGLAGENSCIRLVLFFFMENRSVESILAFQEICRWLYVQSSRTLYFTVCFSFVLRTLPLPTHNKMEDLDIVAE